MIFNFHGSNWIIFDRLRAQNYDIDTGDSDGKFQPADIFKIWSGQLQRITYSYKYISTST